MSNPTVGVLTTFSDLNPSYSLASVTHSHLVMLKKYGYKTVFFVLDNFKDDHLVPDGIEIRKIVPRFKLVDYSNNQPLQPDFEEQVNSAYQAFKENMKDIDIIIEADLIFQGWFLPYCVAIHKLAEETKIKWFHWVHSVANMMPEGLTGDLTKRYYLPKNSKLVYLNNYHLIRTAEAYHIFPKDVRIVYNALDSRLFSNPHPLVRSLIDRYDLLDHDYMQIYPVSTPRMVSGKGLYALIEIFGQLKKLGKKVKLVITNAHANADRDKELIRQAQQYGVDQGLTMNELIFTSLEDKPNYEAGVPREVISQLFQLSNLFVFPTTSENCSLILLEAMLSKCLLVLNKNVGSLREFGKENALYFEFEGLDEKVTYNDREKYMKDVALIINSEFSTNKALKAQNDIKQHYNLDYIFRHQIEPILNEN